MILTYVATWMEELPNLEDLVIQGDFDDEELVTEVYDRHEMAQYKRAIALQIHESV